MGPSAFRKKQRNRFLCRFLCCKIALDQPSDHPEDQNLDIPAGAGYAAELARRGGVDDRCKAAKQYPKIDAEELYGGESNKSNQRDEYPVLNHGRALFVADHEGESSQHSIFS